MDRAPKVEQEVGEEDFFESQGPLYWDTVPVRPQQEQEEEEYDCCGGIENEDDMGQSSWSGFHASQTLGVVHGWGEDKIILR